MIGVMGAVALGPALSGTAWTAAVKARLKAAHKGDFEGNCAHEILFLVGGVHHSKEEFGKYFLGSRAGGELSAARRVEGAELARPAVG